MIVVLRDLSMPIDQLEKISDFKFSILVCLLHQIRHLFHSDFVILSFRLLYACYIKLDIGFI